MDIAFHRPDPVLRVPESQRPARCWETDDVCVLDDSHYFLRGVLFVPVRGELRFGWGIWAKATKAQVFDYLSHLHDDLSGRPPFPGHAASTVTLPEYADLEGHPLVIQLGSATKRPTFSLGESQHLLSLEQRGGIDMARVHSILERLLPRLFE
jgi:hypothetical protein